MASKRNKPKPPIWLSIWRSDGKLWYVERADLERLIQERNVPDSILRRRLGAGYGYVAQLLDGARLDGWAISHVEWGFTAALTELEKDTERGEKTGKPR